MVEEFPQDMAFIEEIHNKFTNERKEVLIKLLGDPFKKYVKIKTLSIELQSMVRGIDVAKLQLFKDVNCMEVDKFESFYAFDPSCSIECNTEKYSLSKHHKSYIKRTRSAGWMGIFRPCNTRAFMYKMYRSESRLQLWAFLVWMCNYFRSIMKKQLIGYDNACGLAAVWKNSKHTSFSQGSKLLSTLPFVYDRLHLGGHKFKRCKEEYNIDRIPGTENWNTECAEKDYADFYLHKQLFHHTSKERSAIWVALIFHEKNMQNEMTINNSKGSFCNRWENNHKIRPTEK